MDCNAEPKIKVLVEITHWDGVLDFIIFVFDGLAGNTCDDERLGIQYILFLICFVCNNGHTLSQGNILSLGVLSVGWNVYLLFIRVEQVSIHTFTVDTNTSSVSICDIQVGLFYGFKSFNVNAIDIIT